MRSTTARDEREAPRHICACRARSRPPGPARRPARRRRAIAAEGYEFDGLGQGHVLRCGAWRTNIEHRFGFGKKLSIFLKSGRTANSASGEVSRRTNGPINAARSDPEADKE